MDEDEDETEALGPDTIAHPTTDAPRPGSTAEAAIVRTPVEALPRQPLALATTDSDRAGGRRIPPPLSFEPRGMMGIISETKRRLDAENTVHDLDPGLVDPSPFRDRLGDRTPDLDIKDLLDDIEQHDQKTPARVRPHPDKPGRYQTVYGHRRRLVAIALNRPLKAIIEDLDDERLVLLQVGENAHRNELSFSEKALMTVDMRGRGFSDAKIAKALGIAEKGVYDFTTVVTDITRPYIERIGKAATIGRRRWTKFAMTLRNEVARRAVDEAMGEGDFDGRDSTDRFETVEQRALAAGQITDDVPANEEPRVTVDPKTRTMTWTDPGFGRFLASQRQELWERYEQSKRKKKP